MTTARRASASEIALALSTRIEGGEWRPQDRLPPERDLARDLECSRETIRAALARLQAEGQIWRQQGKGTFVGPGPALVGRDPRQVIDSASIRDLIEARLVYEPALAAAAAERATDQDIRQMAELAQQTGRAPDWREYERLDNAFHQSVAQASGNPLLLAIYLNLVAARGRAQWQRNHDAVFRKARRLEYALAQGRMHLDVVEAIAARDGQGAHAAMARHLAAIRDLVLDQP